MRCCYFISVRLAVDNVCSLQFVNKWSHVWVKVKHLSPGCVRGQELRYEPADVISSQSVKQEVYESRSQGVCGAVCSGSQSLR